MSTEKYHLTFNSEKEGWDIKKEGASRPSDHFESLDDALKRARELTVNSDTHLIIHDKSGAITGSESAEDISKGILTKVGEKITGAVGAVTSAIKT